MKFCMFSQNKTTKQRTWYPGSSSMICNTVVNQFSYIVCYLYIYIYVYISVVVMVISNCNQL